MHLTGCGMIIIVWQSNQMPVKLYKLQQCWTDVTAGHRKAFNFFFIFIKYICIK